MLIWKNNPNRLEIETLFIQPTRWCGLNCKGCYVKEHAGDENGFHTSWSEQVKLVKYFLETEKASANQITISIDNLPKDHPDRKQDMLNLFNAIQDDAVDARANKHDTEIHMTFHDENVFLDYSRELTGGVYYAHTFLDMISFSNIRDLEKAKILADGVHLNYNHLIPSNVTSFNIRSHVDRLTKIAEVVDSIYLVIHKSPVGGVRNELVELGDKQRMRSDLRYIKTMMEQLPPSARRKLNVDGCVQDVDKFKKTSFGCSSNISKFQVWPDGSVSGCPYAFKGSTPIGTTADDIMDNIREARGHYDFRERCHLPAVTDSLTR
jgi:hypothetical protein